MGLRSLSGFYKIMATCDYPEGVLDYIKGQMSPVSPEELRKITFDLTESILDPDDL